MGGMCSTEGGPPLIQAARDNDIEEVKRLLASGVDINDTDEAQWTALHVATAAHSHQMAHDGEGEELAQKIEIVKLLISKGANINAQTRAGATPLHETAFNDFEEAAEMLIAAGCDIDPLNVGGRSPLHLACEQGCLAIAMMLLKKNADGNRQDRDGETPFLNASDSCKKALHEFGFQGDMSTTDEARDKAFVENLADEVGADGLGTTAKAASSDRQGALKKSDKSEKSGMLSVKIEKIGDELSFFIQRGKYLKDCDVYGGNDVYVVTSVGTEDEAKPGDMQHQRTSTIKDAGADPVWEQGRGEQLTFLDVPKDFEDIYFRCYDEDLGGEMNHDLIGMHKVALSKVKQLRGDGSEDWEWEADVQLRTNKMEEQNLPPVTSDRYRPPEELDAAGNPLAGGVAAT